MTNKKQDTTASYVTITYDQTNVVIEGTSIEINLNIPLAGPISITPEEYLLSDRSYVSEMAKKLDFSDAPPIERKEIEDRKLDRLISSLVLKIPLGITEKDLTEVKQELFPYSKRVACDMCKAETLVLCKEPKALAADMVCGTCDKKLKTLLGATKTQSNAYQYPLSHKK